MHPLWLSLEIGFAALALIIVMGIIVNYIMECYSFPGKGLLDAILTLPLVLPPVVVGFGLLMLFSPSRPLGSLLEELGLEVIFTKGGAILAATIVAFPLFYKTLRGALLSGNKDVKEAARTLGASKGRIFFTMSLPLAWRGLVTGAILAFCRALGEFGATILVAGNIPGLTRTLPLAIYSTVEQGAYAEALYYVMIISSVSLSLMWIVHCLSERLSGKTERD